MTMKKHYNAEGLRKFIEDRCTFVAGGHYVYTGPPTVQCNFKEMAVPRAWWLLNGRQIPSGKYLLTACGHLGCIDCDHWALSHSPHSITNAAKPRDLVKLRRALEGALAALDELEQS